MAATDLLPRLSDHPDAARILSARMKEGVALAMVDATGLSEEDREALLQRVREAIADLDGVSEARVALTARKTGRTTIAIGSGKGGVGKSTLTANLAVALAKMGRKVGVIDADIYGPSQPTLLGAKGKPEAQDDQLLPVDTTHGVSLLSVGQLVSEGTALAWRGPMAAGALGRLIEGKWDAVDTLLIDLPPGTGDVQLSLIQKARPDGAVIVSTPQDLSLIDATRAIDLFRKTEVPVLGLIENMAGYQCPHCGEESDPFGSGGAEASAKSLDVDFLGRLPLSAILREASDAGSPPAAGDGPAADAFAELARAVIAATEKVAR